MLQSPALTTDRARWHAHALLFLCVSFVTRAVVLPVRIVDIDESSHLTAAWVLRAGGRLYVDAADHKPPLVFLYYALTQVFGHGMLSVRLVTHVVWVPLTALAVSRLWADERRQRIAGLVFLLASVSFFGHDTLAVNTELLGLLPMALALVAVRDTERLARPGALMAAGVLVGCACLFRYQLGVALPAIAIGAGLAVPSWRLRLRACLLLGAAFLVPELAAWLLFAVRGSGSAYLYWNFAHNLAYTSSGLTASEIAGRVIRYPVPILLTLLPLIGLAWRGRADLERPVAGMLGALAIGIFAAGFLGWRVYPHYFLPLVVPLAIAAAPCLGALVLPARGRAGRWLAGYGVGIVAAQVVVTAWLYSGHARAQQETRPVFDRVAERLKRDPCYQGARLFVWGYAPMFYTASDLLPASRFLYVDTTLVGHVSAHDRLQPELIRPDHWEQLMSDLSRHPPAFVLDAAGARLARWSVPMSRHSRMQTFVQSRYDPLVVTDRVIIYRRHGCAAGVAG